MELTAKPSAVVTEQLVADEDEPPVPESTVEEVHSTATGSETLADSDELELEVELPESLEITESRLSDVLSDPDSLHPANEIEIGSIITIKPGA